MSYSFGFELEHGGDVAAKVAEHFDQEARGFADPEARRALMAEVEPAVVVAAKAMLDATARPGDKVGVTISGHHNAGRMPDPGWADCYMSIVVSQRPAEKAEATA